MHRSRQTHAPIGNPAPSAARGTQQLRHVTWSKAWAVCGVLLGICGALRPVAAALEQPNIIFVMGDDLDQCRVPVKGMLSLYIGGMGSRRKNFYKDIATELGFEVESEKIQELYLSGHKREAIATVPNALVDAVTLAGPKERISERLERWKSSGASTLIVVTRDMRTLQLMAELVF